MARTEKVETVVMTIRDGIRSGQFRLGDRLAESKLIKLSGQGAGPVREALRILSGAGVIEIQENRGARLGVLSAEEGGQALYLFAHLFQVPLSYEQGTAWQDLGAALDNLIVRLEALIDADSASSGIAFVDFLTAYFSAQPNKYMEALLTTLTPDLIIARIMSHPPGGKAAAELVGHVKRVRRACIDRDTVKLTGAMLACAARLGFRVDQTDWTGAPKAAPAVNEAQDSSTGKIISYILAGIRANRIGPGQRLVEADLIAETGIGRTPVRQALRILAGHNLVEIIPNRGARVKKLGRQDLKDILLIIFLISKLGIEGALKLNPLPKVRRVLQNSMQRAEFSARERNSYQFMSKLIEYHSDLNALSGNVYLNRSFGVLHTEYFLRELSQMMTIESWSQYVRRYKSITRKIVKGEADAAVAELKIHLDDLLFLLESEEEMVF